MARPTISGTATATTQLTAGVQYIPYTSPTGGITLASGAIYRDVVVDASALTSSYLFNGTGVSNVVIQNVRIINLPKTKGAVSFTSSTNVRVLDCTIASGGRGITFDACDNVQAIGNDITLTTDVASGFTGHGILYYANAAPHAGAVIRGNRISAVTTYAHGIYGWGSDAAVLAGAVNASDIVVADNIIETAQGGIWFSKCQRVSVTGNVLTDCNDVGIDFEGSLDCTATGNDIKNGRNGAMACLYNSKRITMSGNSITSTLTTLLGGGQQPSTSCISLYIRDSCEDILFENNTITSTGSSRTTEVILWKNAQSTGSKRVKIRCNDFVNGLVQALDLQDNVTIESNSFYGDFDIPAANNAIVWLQKSRNCTVRNNRISLAADSTQIAVDGLAQIYIDQNGIAAGTYQVKGIVVEGNEVRNCAGVYLSTKTGSTPDGGNYVIRDNVVNRVKHSGVTATASLVTNNLVPDTLAAATVTSF